MITVLTPTYNRSATLPRLYNSLLEQTSKKLEWLIIDDGSTDDTEILINSYRTQGQLSIVYKKQENSGKHAALNNGAVYASTDWILILDSDDALTSDAVATVNRDIEQLTNIATGANNGAGTVGFCYRKSYFNGNLIGRSLNGDQVIHLTPTQAGALLQGDLVYVFRKQALRACPFPTYDGEKFVPELYIWNKIGDLGKIYCRTGKVLYLCDYLSDGYTKNFKKNLRNNPRGFFVYYRSQISRERSLMRKIKCAIRSTQCLYYIFLKNIK